MLVKVNKTKLWWTMKIRQMVPRPFLHVGQHVEKRAERSENLILQRCVCAQIIIGSGSD